MGTEYYTYTSATEFCDITIIINLYQWNIRGRDNLSNKEMKTLHSASVNYRRIQLTKQHNTH
jgi:hypothetical protein